MVFSSFSAVVVSVHKVILVVDMVEKTVLEKEFCICNDLIIISTFWGFSVVVS